MYAMGYDLHRHLEGCHTAPALLQVAKNPRFPGFKTVEGQAIPPDELVRHVTMGTQQGWNPFYNCIELARQAYWHFSAITELTRLAFLDACNEAERVRPERGSVVELRFSPISMTQRYIKAICASVDESNVEFLLRYMRPVVEAVISGKQAARLSSGGTPLLLRLGLTRGFRHEAWLRAVELVGTERAKEFCGLDVFGKGITHFEELSEPFLRTMGALRGSLDDLTLHAGENEGADSVERALALKPAAIGHGIRALEKPALVRQLARCGVTLEVCPTSNDKLLSSALTELTSRGRPHPLVQLMDAGVNCVVCTDDPVVLGSTLQSEWARAEREGADLAALCAQAARRGQTLAHQ